jgi:hypothetical protein
MSTESPASTYICMWAARSDPALVLRDTEVRVQKRLTDVDDAHMRTLILLVLSLGPLSHAGGALADSDATTKVAVAGDCLEYRGELTQEANRRAFAFFEDAPRKPHRVCIDSDGGSAEAGMQLGAWIFTNSLSVSVSTRCLSSCASYVFIAGRTKSLSPHATLMWHGGATQPISTAQLNVLLDTTLASMSDSERGQFLRHYSRESLLSELERSHQQLIDAEQRFFQMLGVDPRIATLGHLHQRELLRPGQYFVGWDYSLEDLATLGIHDVNILDDRAWTPRRTLEQGEIFRLELRRLPGFEPMRATRDGS